MSTALVYQLRVRNAADSADALTVTSISGGTNPYYLEPPSGDGQTLDVLQGKLQIGAFTVQVIDAVTATDTRVVTAQLADSLGRQQLLSRRAYVEVSSNGGSTWAVLMDGYVNAIRLVDPLTYEFTVGESLRTEQTRQVFASTSTGTAADSTTWAFDSVTCLIGGPIKGGWGPLRDYGAWRMRVVAVDAGTGTVDLEFRSGWMTDTVAVTADNGVGAVGVQMYVYRTNDISDSARKRANALAKPYFVPSATYNSVGSAGSFPGLVGEVRHTDDASVVGTYLVVSADLSAGVFPPLADALFTTGSRARVRLAWSVSPPSVSDEFDLYVYPTAISEKNPLHWEGHPVEFAAQVLRSIGLPPNATSVTNVKAALGDNLLVRYRFTAAEAAGPLIEKAAFGPFGFAMRRKADGTGWEFVTTRLLSATTPSETISDSICLDGETVVYDIAESTQVNYLVWKQKKFTLWTEGDQKDERPADDIVATDQTIEPDPADTALATEISQYGRHDLVYELPGELAGNLSYSIDTALDAVAWVRGLFTDLFNRFGRGCDSGEVPILRGSLTARVGDFVLVTLSHKPGADAADSPVSQRGTTRVAQITRRTPVPEGEVYAFLDAGSSTAASTVPTLTIAKSAAYPRHVAVVTITNAATLAAAGYHVRIEYATGASPTAGTFVAVVDPATVTSLDLPPVDAGSIVSARARAEYKGHTPSAFSTFVNVTLDSIPAISGLSAAAGPDDTQEKLTWTVGDAALSVLVFWKLSTDTIYPYYTVLPAGSTQYTIPGLTPGVAYVANVVHRDAKPYEGYSADVTVSFTTGASVPTCSAPTNPAVFAGSPGTNGVLQIDGTYGLQVTATELPSSVEFYMAVETAIGSGTPGSYSLLASVAAVSGGVTRVQDVAPNDGKLRWLKAKSVRPGATDSAYTTALSVDPWGITAPPSVDAAGEFVLVAADSSLPNSRTLTAGTGLSLTDGGAGSTVTIDAALALDDLTDVNAPTPSDGDVLTWDATPGEWVPLAPTGGGGTLARASVTQTTASLANLGVENGTVTLGKAGLMFKVVVDQFCRVRLYKTAAARTADASRSVGTDPSLVAGVITDLLFNTNTGLTLDVQVYEYENGDGSPSSDIYYAIENRSGGTNTVAVTFTHIALES